MLSEIADAVTAASAVAVAVFAWQGLNAWRDQARGTRRSQLAADVLADFYRCKSVIATLRNPFYRAHEYADMENPSRDGIALHVIAKRQEAHMDFLTAFQAKRFAFIAVFGSQYEAPFLDIIKLINEIGSTAQSLANMHGEDNETSRSFRSTLHAEEGDKISKLVDQTVATIEAVCRPEIEYAAPKKP